MAATLYHLSVLSEGGRTIFTRPGSLLRAVRRIALHLGSRNLWFSVADTHLHAVVEATPDEVGVLRRDIKCTLDGLGLEDFQPPRTRPILDQRHLENCWPYVVGNRQKHGIVGAGFKDVGARILDGFDRTKWKAHLPRRSLGDQLQALGVPATASAPASQERVAALGSAAVVRAAAATIGWPDLTGRTPSVVAARGAALRVGCAAGIPRRELAEALGVGRHTARRMTVRKADAFDAALLIRISYDDALQSLA
jgi:hypothetical protein